MTSLATTAVLQPSNGTTVKAVRSPRLLSLDEFRRRYSDRGEGKYQFEYNNGLIEKTISNTKINQFHIIDNITEGFRKTIAFSKGDRLATEIDQFTSSLQLRRPDLALVLRSKILINDETISGFVIEIISPTDRADDINRKCREYFRAGVQVFWQIHPATQSISVYTSPTQVTICEGETVCSGTPALPDFEMTAEEIFRK
jgi:Uma2 family endonuclease